MTNKTNILELFHELDLLHRDRNFLVDAYEHLDVEDERYEEYEYQLKENLQQIHKTWHEIRKLTGNT